ncbi:uncharacterized protein BX664DRAFT_340362 [Halteromyces radiatus]|uniref:uncharacterized protein n=1 Tax=Halteromyces radiatus TaxID=101107 RepID=UPI002220B324|nr:uncharacterized protein BX664DRAFT_340362 [Halteromyces radiatus]KAI8081422.1 hypothetical protein BX664DRAFT_340362 [Halteromyces radiatus]
MTITKTTDPLLNNEPHSPLTNCTSLPQKRPLNDDSPMLTKKKQLFIKRSRNCTNYTQACLLLHAIEINRRQVLNARCIAHLANFVVKAWETDPNETKVRHLYQLMQSLLSTTGIKQTTLETALVTFCRNTASTPTPCPSVTLLIAISYIERLNKKYDIIRGTVGCGSRLIMVAYLMAAKFLHDNLRLIIHVPATNPSPSSSLSIPSTTTTTSIPSTSISSSSTSHPVTDSLVEKSSSTLPSSPPTSPSQSSGNNIFMSSSSSTQQTSSEPPLTPPHPSTKITTRTPNERNLRIMRLELEFLHFLDYDLSTPDPARLVRWAHTFDTPPVPVDDCTSADEGDDEMDDDDDTCSLD